MAAANAELAELAKLERFARPFGADGLARMRVFFDEHDTPREEYVRCTPQYLFKKMRRAPPPPASAHSRVVRALVASPTTNPQLAHPGNPEIAHSPPTNQPLLCGITSPFFRAVAS